MVLGSRPLVDGCSADGGRCVCPFAPPCCARRFASRSAFSAASARAAAAATTSGGAKAAVRVGPESPAGGAPADVDGVAAVPLRAYMFSRELFMRLAVAVAPAARARASPPPLSPLSAPSPLLVPLPLPPSDRLVDASLVDPAPLLTPVAASLTAP